MSGKALCKNETYVITAFSSGFFTWISVRGGGGGGEREGERERRGRGRGGEMERQRSSMLLCQMYMYMYNVQCIYHLHIKLTCIHTLSRK